MKDKKLKTKSQMRRDLAIHHEQLAAILYLLGEWQITPTYFSNLVRVSPKDVKDLLNGKFSLGINLGTDGYIIRGIVVLTKMLPLSFKPTCLVANTKDFNQRFENLFIEASTYDAKYTMEELLFHVWEAKRNHEKVKGYLQHYAPDLKNIVGEWRRTLKVYDADTSDFLTQCGIGYNEGNLIACNSEEIFYTPQGRNAFSRFEYVVSYLNSTPLDTNPHKVSDVITRVRLGMADVELVEGGNPAGIVANPEEPQTESAA